MGWRTNNILLVAAILLGIVCVIDARHLRTTEDREKAERKIFDFEEGALRAFEVTRDEEVFTLVKDTDSLWYVAKPIRYRADQAAAEAFEFELRTLRKKFDVSVDDPENLEVYGLSEPRLRLRFWITDEPQEVGVGNEVPEGDVYIHVGGAKPAVYTVRSSLYDTLARDLKDLRDRRLLPFETYNVQALALQEGAWIVEWLKTDGMVARLEAELSDPTNFGMAKSIFMSGTNSGYDMTSEAGMAEFMAAYNQSLLQSDTVPETVSAPVTTVSRRQRIGRNDPCPCGSGKKYKKCCR